MARLHRGRNLVNMCAQSNKENVPKTNINQHITNNVNDTISDSTKELPLPEKNLDLPSPNYEPTIWMQPYSMTEPIFTQFNECEISDLGTINEVLEKFKDEASTSYNKPNQMESKNLQCHSDLTCYEGIESVVSSDDCCDIFDSDDSVKDKDYVQPQQTEISSSSDENDNIYFPTPAILNSSPVKEKPSKSNENSVHSNLNENKTTISVASLVSLCKNVIGKKCQEQTINTTGNEYLDLGNQINQGNKEPENESMIEYCDEITIEIEVEKPCNDINEENVQEKLGEMQLYTKSGNLRKRKRHETSLKDRTQAKKTKYIATFAVKEGCGEKCTKACRSKVSEDERKYLNECFWAKNWKERRMFLQQSSCVAIPKRKITAAPKRHPRRNFSLQIRDGTSIEVCKTFFLTTLGYKSTNDKVLYSYNALSAEGFDLEDKRGKHTRESLINKNEITKHIECFNPTISHYRREHAPNRRYLPSDITVKIMYADFTEKNPEMKISYDLYRKHLKFLNISFARLGHEECEICEAHHIHCESESHDKNTVPDDCEICIDFQNHKIRSVKARTLYSKHKEQKNENVSHIYFSADLQKVIMLPRLENFKEALFCQRIVAYNQSLTPLGKTGIHKPYAALWHEATAGRKQQDIISAFKAFFNHYRDSEIIDLWLDNCSAQNKNWLLYFVLVDFINSKETCTKQITLNYFEKGHTYMSSDHFHHQVELAMKKKGKLYDFQDFVEAVNTANSGKVVVKEMQISDFINISDHTSSRRIQVLSPRVYIRDIVQVAFERGSHNMSFKTDMEGESKELCFIKDTYIKPKNGPITVTTNRTVKRGIAESRKADILKKLSKLMPPHKLKFWEDITTSNNEERDD